MNQKVFHKVVLASGSPRRQELLSEIFPTFEVLVSHIDENPLTVADPYATAEGLAEAKAVAVAHLRPECLVIGGDTVVAIPDDRGGFQQLTKPIDYADAAKMLERLSGRSHLVITGICLIWPGGKKVFSESSTVTFRDLASDEIREYVATGETMDKAGGYAIQGGAKHFVASMDGSLSNVVGLPLERLRQTLDEGPHAKTARLS